LRGNEFEKINNFKGMVNEFLSQIPIDMFKYISRTWSRDWINN
jgi:hypothetical protein